MSNSTTTTASAVSAVSAATSAASSSVSEDSSSAGVEQLEEMLQQQQQQQNQQQQNQSIDFSTLTSAELCQLLEDKTKMQGKIESEVAGAMNVLVAQGNVGMSKSLVDAEGFPRNDIDVTAVRGARHTIATRKNDLKLLGEDLHKLVEAIFAAQARESGGESPEEVNLKREAQRRARVEAEKKRKEEEEAMKNNSENENNNNKKKSNEPVDLLAELIRLRINRWKESKPCCVVRDVSNGSPANKCGLLEDDLILGIGKDKGDELTPEDCIQPCKTLEHVAGLIVKSEGQPLRVVVQRIASGSEMLKQAYTPPASENQNSNASSSALPPSKPKPVVFVELVLVPLRWSGRGILGCGLEPAGVSR